MQDAKKIDHADRLDLLCMSQNTQPFLVLGGCTTCMSCMFSWSKDRWAPEEKYSASDIARVTSDLMRLPIAGSPEAITAASKDRDRAAFDEVSKGHPPASHSASTWP